MEFLPGDLVWLHLRKERFPTRRKSKLKARGDRPYKVLVKVGANANKLELVGNMAISVTFNVCDLSPYVEDEIEFRDLRANPLKGGEGDADQEPVQGPHPEPKKGLMLNHQPGLFCEAMQLSIEATLGRSLLCWTP